MPVLGQNSGQIRVATTGHLYVAPVGTVAPTDTVAAWGTGWQDLGYTDDSGVAFGKKDSWDQIDLWQVMVPGRFVPKSRELSFKFQMTQLNAVTLPLWGGGSTVADSATQATTEYTYQISPTLTAYERALGVEFSDSNGAVVYRLVVSRGMVTDTTDINLTRSKGALLGVTFQVLAVDSTTPLVQFYMRDPNMVP